MNAKKKTYLIGCVFVISFVLFGCFSKKKENESSRQKVAAQTIVQESGKKEPPRFVDNGDGTIIDNYSGLLWEKEASGNMNWDEAVEYCRDVVDAGGKKNWRLPTPQEFLNILNNTNSDCMLPSVFERRGYQCVYHWTSEIFSSGMVRVIEPSDAELDKIHKDGRNGKGMTRCVKNDGEVRLFVINDKRCIDCFPQRLIDKFKEVFPKLVVRELDYNSEEGRRLYQLLGIELLPAYIFEKNITEEPGYNCQYERFFRDIGGYKVLRVGGKFDPITQF